MPCRFTVEHIMVLKKLYKIITVRVKEGKKKLEKGKKKTEWENVPL